MKKIKYLIAALMLCAPLLVNADSLSDNKAKSDQYKQELKILNQEIKVPKKPSRSFLVHNIPPDCLVINKPVTCNSPSVSLCRGNSRPLRFRASESG